MMSPRNSVGKIIAAAAWCGIADNIGDRIYSGGGNVSRVRDREDSSIVRSEVRAPIAAPRIALRRSRPALDASPAAVSGALITKELPSINLGKVAP
jgi:hypothetical protein